MNARENPIRYLFHAHRCVFGHGTCNYRCYAAAHKHQLVFILAMVSLCFPSAATLQIRNYRCLCGCTQAPTSYHLGEFSSPICSHPAILNESELMKTINYFDRSDRRVQLLKGLTHHSLVIAKRSLD